MLIMNGNQMKSMGIQAALTGSLPIKPCHAPVVLCGDLLSEISVYQPDQGCD